MSSERMPRDPVLASLWQFDPDGATDDPDVEAMPAALSFVRSETGEEARVLIAVRGRPQGRRYERTDSVWLEFADAEALRPHRTDRGDDEIGAMTPDRYPLGATLVFVDANATVSDDSTVAARGVVNGPPLLDEDGVVFLVPVFVAWDHGREATTVYVHVTNVLGVE